MIRISVSQLDAYLSKFRLKLSHNHLLHLQKLGVSLNAIQQFIVEWGKVRSGQGAVNFRAVEVMSAGEFVGKMGKNIEGINFLDIRSYLENSKVPLIHVSGFNSNFSQIAKKIASYSDYGEPRCPYRVLPILIVL